MIAPENQWIADKFLAAIAWSARDMLKGIDPTIEQHEAARQRLLAHWLMQVAPAGCA